MIAVARRAQFANNAANNNTTINLPANTHLSHQRLYGCRLRRRHGRPRRPCRSLAREPRPIIRQTGTGVASDGDRVMCMNEPFSLNLVYNFSGFTMVGGREGTAAGGGAALGGAGIIGGEETIH